MNPVFGRVLVANRGEIALRVFRALRELGIGCVAVYSEPDADALHVRAADDAFLIGPAPARDSYLNQDRLIDAAQRGGAEAIHPGYGFLAENATFARRCAEAGLVWIGPPPESIEAMGSKIRARRIMHEAGVPVVPGVTEPVTDADTVISLGEQFGWPVALKAASGGGGKGLRVVEQADQAARMLEAARREGQAYFADDTVYVEKYLSDPRHVEVQLMADQHGAIVALGERDCTLQRRHQKIVEETPSPAVTAATRRHLETLAISAGRAVSYVGAGTIECLMDRDQSVFFLEMNTRIQVEHTITEMVYGIDLVREQVLVAAGRPLSFAASDIQPRGHAIQCRINAEDAAAGFTPSPGRVTRYREPGGPGVRVDSALEEGGEVIAAYDPMVAKLVVWDRDRDHARARMRRALDEMVVEGVATLIPLHRLIMRSEEFARGETCAGMVDTIWPALLRDASAEPAAAAPPPAETSPSAAATPARALIAEVNGRRFAVTIHTPPDPVAVEMRARRERRRHPATGSGGPGAVRSPMQGTVLRVAAANGDAVRQGYVIAIVEAMKMENEIVAPRAGIVQNLALSVGDAVNAGQLICGIEPAAAASASE